MHINSGFLYCSPLMPPWAPIAGHVMWPTWWCVPRGRLWAQFWKDHVQAKRCSAPLLNCNFGLGAIHTTLILLASPSLIWNSNTNKCTFTSIHVLPNHLNCAPLSTSCAGNGGLSLVALCPSSPLAAAWCLYWGLGCGHFNSWLLGSACWHQGCCRHDGWWHTQSKNSVGYTT